MGDELQFAARFNDIEMFRYCEQCGRCSSACPITGINGFNIRRLIRHIELDLIEEIADTSMPLTSTRRSRSVAGFIVVVTTAG